MKTLASFAGGRRALAAVGVQPTQYQLLIDLFAALGERKELTGNLGMDRQALQLVGFMLLLPGAMFALLAFAPISLASYEITVLSASSAVLLLLLVTEASNSFLNPAEISVLAHRPISGATYFAAKLSYLILVVLRAELALNGLAALAVAFRADARWFVALTHLAAALSAGVFLALVACALFGVMMRVVPLSRLRAAALWLQLVAGLLPISFNLARPMARAIGAFLRPYTNFDWSFAPVVWFAALATAGQAQAARITWWPGAAIGMLVASGFIAFGVRALSAGYMTRIVAITRTTRGSTRRRRPSLMSLVVGRLSGSPAGQAAFEFMTRMMRRDWQFRRSATQWILMVLIYVPILRRGLGAPSPFSGGQPTAVAILPELLSVLTLFVCLAVSFSDHYRAAWIFNQAPAGALKRYVRGAFWSIWLLFCAIPMFVTAAALAWGWALSDGLLFGVYGMSVSTLLLAMQFFLVDGLPFGEAPKATRMYMMLPVIVFGPVVVGIAWFVQARFLFQSRAATAIAALGLAVAAVLVARQTTLAVVARIRQTLADRASGGPAMFKIVDES
jgi:hypothetical protein